MLNEKRWKQDRWRDHVWTAVIQNFRVPDEPIVVELEKISSGQVDVQILCGKGKYIPVSPSLHAGVDEAQDAACRAIKHHFQSDRYARFVFQFIPWKTVRECQPFFEDHHRTIGVWFTKPDARMTRAAVNEVLRNIGIKSSRGDRFRGETDTFVLNEAVWEIAPEAGA